MAVETPAYGLKTPEGMEMTACRRLFSMISLRMALWAFWEPNSTPSGTMEAQRPPTLRLLRKSAKNSSSVLVVAAMLRRSLATVSLSRLPLKGGLARIRV